MCLANKSFTQSGQRKHKGEGVEGRDEGGGQRREGKDRGVRGEIEILDLEGEIS